METQWKAALTIIAACMTMGSLVLFIIIVHINHRRKSLAKDNQLKSLESEMQVLLLKTTMEAEEREKERIYRNFHDEVNPMLRFVMRRIESHRNALARNRLTVDALNEDIEMLLKVLESIKTCTYELVPSYLMDVGLFRSLEYVIQKLNVPGSINTSFVTRSPLVSSIVFSQSEQLNIYRLTLEIINNILQHSGCNRLKVSVDASYGNLLIELRHNGNGVNTLQIERLTREGSGHGLKSVKARALLVNGRIDYLFSPHEPYVLITIPYKP